MGPIVSPPAVLPSRRWLVLAIIPVALGLVRAHPPDGPTRGTDGDALRAIAASHRLWVRDHGPGCARTLEHLAPYNTGPTFDRDRWGHSLHFECERRESYEYHIVVTVTSDGPDGARGTDDDVIAVDVSAAGTAQRPLAI